MGTIEIHTPDLTLSEPTFVEGFPGVGLVGKIASDHLVSEFDMTHYATCHCEGFPELAIYHENDTSITGAVRIYADEDRDLLVLVSDVPVSPDTAEKFANLIVGWLDDMNALPVFLSGRPASPDGEPEMYGVAVGELNQRLLDNNIEPPHEHGAISGPTGALLYECTRQDVDALGLIVEASPQLPDPGSAKYLIEHGIAPLAGIDVETNRLVEKAEEIRATRQKLAQRMQQASEESSKAEPVGMYH